MNTVPAPQRAARLRATLHITSAQVSAIDLSDLHGSSLVSLELGDDQAAVCVLASVNELSAIVTEAARQLAALPEATQQPRADQ